MRDLGEIHQGRTLTQPTRAELKAFHRQADPLLEREVIWFNDDARTAVARGFENASRERGYVVFACAILRNHAHLVVARHKDPYQVMWPSFAEFARSSLCEAGLVTREHPVWGNRPYSKFLYTPDDVRGRVNYVEENPGKEGLSRQAWEWTRLVNR